jgi:AraC-like DNA-binding protein/mannose-6-phosphate isomerase-like protein (cupin superfamily)
METPHIPVRLDADGKVIGYSLVSYFGFDSRKDSSLKLFMHTHHGYEITYVFEGKVAWELENGETLHLYGGDMALIQPGVRHKGHLDLIEPATIFWVCLEDWTKVKKASDGFTLKDIKYLNRIFGSSGNRVWFADDTIRQLLITLCALLQERYEKPVKRKDDSLLLPELRGLLSAIITLSARIVSGTSHFRVENDYVRAAREYMRQHLAEDISMQNVAQRLGVSRSRMHAVFKAQSGLTPNDYLQRLRIETAQNLFLSTDRNVTHIAFEVGFSSSQYFATCFRKYTGMTPSQFRQRNRQNESEHPREFL